MTQVATNLRNTRESARQIRFEPTTPFTATNVQDAIAQENALLPPEVLAVVTVGAAAIAPGTTEVAIQRIAPSATALSLPPLADGAPIHIFDLSTAVVDHTITLTANGTEKIMNDSTLEVRSNAAQLGSVTLHPSVALNRWYIAP